MNWEFIGKYLPMYEKAALLTVKIGVIGILFAILLGLVCAAIQYYKVPVLRWIVAVYVELSRSIYGKKIRILQCFDIKIKNGML